MAQPSKSEMSSRLSQPESDVAELMKAFAAIRNTDEAMSFLKDIATPAEIAAFAERWRIARMLAGEGASYRAIASETGASTTTIGRVARFLKDEPHGGYRLMLKRTRLKKRNEK